MENQNQVLGLPESQELDRPVRNSALPSPHYGGYYGAGEDAEENHVREYLHAVRKHLWLIIGITLAATLMAAVYVAQQPDIYSAQTRVQVDLENNPASGASKSGTVVINSPTSDPTYFNTQLQNLTSQGLLRRVVKTLDLEHNQAFLQPNREHRTTWQNLLRMVRLNKQGQDEQQSTA